MTTPLPPEPLRSCPLLNWLMLPGEPVRWYRLEKDLGRKPNNRDWWIEITEAEARQIAGEDKR